MAGVVARDVASIRGDSLCSKLGNTHKERFPVQTSGAQLHLSGPQGVPFWAHLGMLPNSSSVDGSNVKLHGFQVEEGI